MLEVTHFTSTLGGAAIVVIAISGLVLMVRNGRLFGTRDRTPFKIGKFLNKPEREIFSLLVETVPADHHVMCQVSYGAILQNRSRERYMSINSKRADFMIFDKSAEVVAVFEYQGTGHFGRSHESKQRAIKGDEIKRASLKEAGIPLLEIPAKYHPSVIHEFVADLTGQNEKAQGIG
jgi:hypothetical protein